VCTDESYIYFWQYFTQILLLYFIKNFLMITTQNIFWKLPVSIFRSVKTLIHLTKDTGSFWNFMHCYNPYPNKCIRQKPGNGLDVIPIHMQLSLIEILFFKVKCFNVAFPKCQRNFNVRKAHTNGTTFSFSVTLLNKRSIKLYKTICDVSWWSVAASFHSTLVFIKICKYIQNIFIHNREMIYVERQRDRMA
jgi:hypothetical protein